jgi:hypothetical protein
VNTRIQAFLRLLWGAGRRAFDILWPLGIFYWTFSLSGPHPLRRTLMVLVVMLVVLVVMIGPFALMRRRRLQTLARRWSKVWTPARGLGQDEMYTARGERTVRPLFLLALVVLTSTPVAAQRSKRKCPDTAVDSTPGGVPTYQACQVDREARQRGSAPRVEWTPPTSELRDGSCMSADFTFVVDTLGIPEIATIRDITATNMGFQQAVRDVIPRLRYEPATLQGARVRQIVAYRQSVAIRVVSSSSPSGRPSSARPPRC